jgi:dTDP-glucose 4,6-dehydratase
MRPEDGRAIPAFVPQALRGEPITVFGDGGQTRSFCFVTDLIEGIYRLLLSGINDPVNIGNPDERTIMDLVRLLLDLTGSRSTVEYRPLPVNDPKIRQPDITKARTQLGWEPRVGLEEGLKITIDWFKKRLERGNAPAG